jgi:uncharacterized protein (TIGR03437 family)
MSKLFSRNALAVLAFVFPVAALAQSAPTVTGITNNYSYIPAGFPNSWFSPSSIVTIFGTNMAAALPLKFQSSAAGLPKTLNETTVSFTVNGITTTAPIYYAIPTQLAVVVPAATPIGSGTLTVTYNNTASNAFPIQVVKSALGLDTFNGTGGGLIAATNPETYALYTYTNSAAPGDTIVLWGSGLGADLQDSDTTYTTTPHSVNQGSIKIYFGGVPGTVVYAGSSGFPGLNQINVTIPESVHLGCNIAVVGTIGGDVSNFGSLAISQPGGGECTDAVFGISGSLISTLSGQTSVKYGDVFVAQLVRPATPPASGTVTDNVAFADFEKETGASFGSSSGSIFSIGSCYVSQVVNISGTIPTIVGLDAGTIKLAGPAGSYTLTSLEKGEYEDLLPAGAITSSGGAFTYNGSGGADVGSFSAAINLPNPLLDWTNQSADAKINRSQGVKVDWTGGGSGTYVIILGSSSNQTTGANGSFTCVANQSDLTFTVPDYVTGTLPAGSGTLTVENVASYTTFTAPSLDFGIGFGFTGNQINVTYQ